MLNAVPKTHRALGLGALDTYFAMARGYQGKEGDVKALTMRKWFNTNYHYMVPVLDSKTEIRLIGNQPFDMYTEALALGVKTRPVVLGPFTFLMLAEYAGDKSDFIEDLVRAYKDIFDRFNELGAEWIQLDEPMLVTDLSEEDAALFMTIYKALLASKGQLKVLLQTYFGDIRDIYTKVTALNFDGIGLDFV